MRFREVGQSQAIEVEDKAAVVARLKESFRRWPDLDHLDPANIEAEYSHEAAPTHEGAPGWGKVYIVTLKGYGVVGFADAPL